MPYIPSGSELLNPKAVLEHAGIRSGMKVADLGCGTTGHFVFPAAHLVGSQGTVYAVDILKSALSGIEGRRKIEGVSNVETLWADIEQPNGVKLPSESLDLVMLINNMPKEAMIREAVRLVKPDGRLLVVDWKPAGAPFGPPSKDRISAVQVTGMVQSLGFKPLEVFDAGQYHFAVVFAR